MAANISSGAYANEYEFMTNLWKVFNSAHDGHFRFLPDILDKALQFRRNVDLVSVSSDGFEIPKIFTRSMFIPFGYEDIEGLTLNLGDIIAMQSGVNFTPSALTLVNGEDVVKVIEDLGQLGVLQDHDASWNTLFYSKAFDTVPGEPFLGYFFNSGMISHHKSRQQYIYQVTSTY